MGPCDTQNSNSNKKQEKKQRIKCIRHTTPFLTNTHTHPKSGKRVKTDENSSPAGRLVYITRTPASTSRHSPSVEKNKQSNVHAYFPFQLPLHVLFSVHWLERTRHHPASVMIFSHSVSLHDFILNKTSYASYATEYFVCPHQLRCQIHLLYTSCLWVAAVSLCHTICKATSNVNYTSY